MSKYQSNASGTVVLTLNVLELNALFALSKEGADAFFDDSVAARRHLGNLDRINAAKRVYKTIRKAALKQAS